jgi:antitoxin (DNA-binding transcriptional repressor) of toxin-antitoxin stability system
MATIHISEAEALKDFPGLLARVRAGEEVVIQSNEHPATVVKLAQERLGSSSTEILARLRARKEELGFSPSMSDEFVADMEEIIRNRKPADRSAWD